MNANAMMRLSEAAVAVNGNLAGNDCEFFAVSTDTRAIKPGDLFIALKGEKFDGAEFAGRAIESGAAGVMINSDASTPVVPSIRVNDTRMGLGQLAAHWRNRFGMPVIAVTGSNGKTTVKEMTAAILRSQTGNPEVVLATEGNLNNDIGCPMMMLRLRASHRYAVLEMGMNHPGEIRYLTNLARPDVALVNNAHMAHIGLMGSVQAIAEAKGEIFEGLNEKGIAIINRDDAHAGYWCEINTGHRILTFGFHPEADVRGIYGSNDKNLLTIHVREQGEATLTLPVPGEHNARNALAAAACALAVGVDLQTIAKALAGFTGVKGRLQRKPGLHGGRFIDDTYNANPDSTRAALDVLAREAGHKYLVLGDMGELGEAAPALHAQVGLAARQAGVERLFGLGDLSKEAVRAFGAGGMHFERIEELLAEVENALAPDVTVLVKGSRAMRMERVVNSLTEEVH
jgi:UDP-N-acetylmuramoyl-tripeptide--D-alanyl-D-alanine ligase